VRAVAAAPNVRVLGLLGGRQRRREEDSGGEGGRRAEVDDAQDRARHTEEDNWSHVSVRAPFIKTVSPPCIILLFYTSFNAKHHQRPPLPIVAWIWAVTGAASPTVLCGVGGPWRPDLVALGRRHVEHVSVTIFHPSPGAAGSMARMVSFIVAGG
jgi:hypothetical protein